MQPVVYVDMVFLLNFTMDFLALFAAGRILNYKISTLRLVLSSVFGSLYNISTFFYSVSVIPDLIINIAVSVAMCFIAYRITSLISFTKIFLIFYLACFMLGGGVEALYYMSGVISENISYANTPVTISAPVIILLSSVVAVIFIFAFRIANRNNATTKKTNIIIGFEGKEAAVDVLIDSGNLLYDPISSMPVLIVNINSVTNLFTDAMLELFLTDSISQIAVTDNDAARRLKFRIIPVKTVNGSSLMIAFVPDYIKIKSSKKNKAVSNIINAVIAVDSNTKNSYGSDCGGIIPQILIDF